MPRRCNASMPGRIAAEMMKPAKSSAITSLSFHRASASTTTPTTTRAATAALRAVCPTRHQRANSVYRHGKPFGALTLLRARGEGEGPRAASDDAARVRHVPAAKALDAYARARVGRVDEAAVSRVDTDMTEAEEEEVAGEQPAAWNVSASRKLRDGVVR